MYEEFYNLNGRPFQLTPDPHFYFSSQTHKKAMAYLTFGLNQGEGFIIVTGEIGTGKTTLVRHLLETLDQNSYVAAMIVSTQLDADNILRSVAGAFNLSENGASKGELLAMIEAYLRKQHRQGRRALLLVDEAQNLPIAALEELRMLSNYQEGSEALLQSFLVGQPEFRDKVFREPELEQLRQRIIASHHLDPIQPEEIASYMEHRLRLVGWENDPCFTSDAVEAIFIHSGGIPRKLNRLCSRLLLFGALEELHTIGYAAVRSVSEDLIAEIDIQKRSGKKQSANALNGSKSSHDASLTQEVVEDRMNRLEDLVRGQNAALEKLTTMLASQVNDEQDD